MKKFNEFKNINEYNSVLKNNNDSYIWYFPIPQRQFEIKIPIELIDNIIKNLKEKTGKNYRSTWSDQELIEEIFNHYIINRLEKVNDELLNFNNITLIEELSKIFI